MICFYKVLVSGVTCRVSHDTSNSQTIRATELKFLEQVHLVPTVSCYVSCVTCQMSCVTCHMSHVTFFFYKGVMLVGEASVINGVDPVYF